MSSSRRDVIRLVGGGAVAAAVPLAGCAPLPDVRAAWVDPGAGEADPRRRALAWALLAPNPHNMQPWMADLREPGVVTLYADPARLLPQTDPFNRQIVVGCGAFLELLRLAAAEGGLDARIAPFPEGEADRLDGRPFARVTFAPGGVADPLFGHALARRTTRAPFDDRPVAEAAARRIAGAARSGATAGFTLEPGRTARLKALAYRGAEIEAHTPAAHRESCERTFIGSRDVAAHPWGVPLDGAAIDAAHAVGLLTREKLETPGTWAYGQSLAFLKGLADTARGFVWLTTAQNRRADQIAAGRDYFRVNAQAAAEGVAMHPWSQCLEEYPAMANLLDETHRELAAQGGRVQMFVRIGYAKPVRPAPRRGLAAQIRSA